MAKTIFLDLSGQRFGRWLVLGPADPYLHRGTGYREARWLCRCDCGTERALRQSSLRTGGTGSCGCLRSEVTAAKNTTHGLGGTPENLIWNSMLHRSRNTSDPLYGGRGITACARWLKFENFLADMGPRPSPAHSIDRIDNDGGYWCGKPSCPDCGPAGRAPNCRWATQSEQTRNQRTNRPITFRGRTQVLEDWAAEVGIAPGQLHWRLAAGWSVERALTEPLRPTRRR